MPAPSRYLLAGVLSLYALAMPGAATYGGVAQAT